MTREEAIKVVNNLKQGIFPADMGIIFDALCLSVDALKEEERPHGEWKRTDNRWGVGIWQCTHCERFYEIATNFCPNCGASMAKEGETK